MPFLVIKPAVCIDGSLLSFNRTLWLNVRRRDGRLFFFIRPVEIQ